MKQVKVLFSYKKKTRKKRWKPAERIKEQKKQQRTTSSTNNSTSNFNWTILTKKLNRTKCLKKWKKNCQFNLYFMMCACLHIARVNEIPIKTAKSGKLWDKKT